MVTWASVDVLAVSETVSFQRSSLDLGELGRARAAPQETPTTFQSDFLSRERVCPCCKWPWFRVDQFLRPRANSRIATMSFSLQYFLRIPPSLRHQLLNLELFAPRINRSNAVLSRTFRTHARHLIRKGGAGSTKQIPKQPPSPAVKQLPSSSAKYSTYIDTLLQSHPQVLIYTAPRHGLFYASSYIIGLFFLFGAYSWAQFALKEPLESGTEDQKRRRPWYVQAALSAEILAVVVIGTAFILAPTKMIQSVAITKAAASSPGAPSGGILLRCQVRRLLPFLKPDVLETAPSNAFLDRRVASAQKSIELFNIPPSRAREFTESYFAGSYKPTIGEVDKLGPVHSVWRAIRRETGRMFLREQMAYVRVPGNGRFKLDLQGCSLVDNGRALESATVAEVEGGTGFREWFRQLRSA